MIVADLHTHTRFSDGKNTIAEMVAAAVKKGLLQFGNTEHGLRHMAFGLERSEMPSLRRQIEENRKAFPDMEILLGIEANIYSSFGDVDLKPADYDYFDYVAAGYHQAAAPKSFADAFRYNFQGIFRKNFSQSQIDLFTKCFIKVIESGKVQIVTHPCYRIPIDVREVAKAARDYGVLLELNGKKVSMTDEEIMTIVDVGAPLIVNSDAHSADRVGDFSVPMKIVERLGFDKSLIVNWEKKVVFNKPSAYKR